MKHDREDKPLNVQKGEYELLRILKLLKDASRPMTAKEIAREVAGRDDEVTLRRIRRKLSLLEREGFVKSVGKSPKEWYYCAVILVSDDVYKRHAKYVIAGLIKVADFTGDYILKTLPKVEREEIETLLSECRTASRDEFKQNALSHLEHGYPEVYAICKKREKAASQYRRIKEDFEKAVSNSLKWRFKCATPTRLTNFIKPNLDDRVYRVDFDRVMSICQGAFSDFVRQDYVDEPEKIRFYLEGDEWGVIKTDNGDIVGVGDARLLRDFHSFSKDVHYYLRSYGSRARRWLNRLLKYSIRLRDELQKIVHEMRQGILKGRCHLCLVSVKSERSA